ncbi:MAG: monovalent cation/H+ antiporter complex subunit F [Bdellovibrionaceae bacterium]|nr:monovalent cation/H+ antiporter complex subunit F [Pseudobdellovibrionaceae bacterium]MDW8189898.1 monovalent cation/H+ antiporter complex subunit F [Pseudobdellovibrionaceae bacterium]
MKDLYFVGYVVLGFSFIMVLLRLIKGPSGVDRVMSIDMITTLMSVFILLFILESDQIVYLDSVMILALISFFGTVMYSRYLESRWKNEGLD